MGISKEEYDQREEFLNILWLESTQVKSLKLDNGMLMVPLKFSGKVKELGLLILRHAKTHGRLMEQQCDGPIHLDTPYWWGKPKQRGKRHDEWSEWRERREMLV